MHLKRENFDSLKLLSIFYKKTVKERFSPGVALKVAKLQYQLGPIYRQWAYLMLIILCIFD
jgi:hypothetical protein